MHKINAYIINFQSESVMVINILKLPEILGSLDDVQADDNEIKQWVIEKDELSKANKIDESNSVKVYIVMAYFNRLNLSKNKLSIEEQKDIIISMTSQLDEIDLNICNPIYNIFLNKFKEDCKIRLEWINFCFKYRITVRFQISRTENAALHKFRDEYEKYNKISEERRSVHDHDCLALASYCLSSNYKFIFDKINTPEAENKARVLIGHAVQYIKQSIDHLEEKQRMLSKYPDLEHIVKETKLKIDQSNIDLRAYALKKAPYIISMGNRGRSGKRRLDYYNAPSDCSLNPASSASEGGSSGDGSSQLQTPRNTGNLNTGSSFFSGGSQVERDKLVGGATNKKAKLANPFNFLDKIPGTELLVNADACFYTGDINWQLSHSEIKSYIHEYSAYINQVDGCSILVKVVNILATNALQDLPKAYTDFFKQLFDDIIPYVSYLNTELYHKAMDTNDLDVLSKVLQLNVNGTSIYEGDSRNENNMSAFELECHKFLLSSDCTKNNYNVKNGLMLIHHSIIYALKNRQDFQLINTIRKNIEKSINISNKNNLMHNRLITLLVCLSSDFEVLTAWMQSSNFKLSNNLMKQEPELKKILSICLNNFWAQKNENKVMLLKSEVDFTDFFENNLHAENKKVYSAIRNFANLIDNEVLLNKVINNYNRYYSDDSITEIITQSKKESLLGVLVYSPGELSAYIERRPDSMAKVYRILFSTGYNWHDLGFNAPKSEDGRDDLAIIEKLTKPFLRLHQ